MKSYIFLHRSPSHIWRQGLSFEPTTCQCSFSTQFYANLTQTRGGNLNQENAFIRSGCRTFSYLVIDVGGPCLLSVEAPLGLDSMRKQAEQGICSKLVSIITQ